MIRKILTVLVAVGMMVISASATIVSKNGIAKDSATGLEWQDNTDVSSVKKDWDGAKQYCENLSLGGKNDWRLPNIYELATLLDNTKKEYPYIIDGFQNNVVLDHFWTSSTYASDTSDARIVYFTYGHDGWGNKTYSLYFRCVRSGQLNFDSLTLLKNKGNLKVNKENIDRIKPKSAQQLYLEAGKLERDGKNDKAKNIYEYIVDTFPNSDFAVKASDKLTSASRAENEASNRRSQSSQECENTKNACLAGCGTYISGADAHNNSVWSCNDRCKKINCY